MIYMVDHVYADAQSEPAWHAWYAEYLHKLVSVPGIHTAQRFKAIGCSPPRFLAMYSIDSEDVYTSEPYKAMGGGGSQSKRFHPAYALWTRNLFDGAQGAPRVAPDQRVVVWDRAEKDTQPSGLPSTVWLKAVGLHMTTAFRALAVIPATAADAPAEIPGSFTYAPMMAPLLEQGSG